MVDERRALARFCAAEAVGAVGGIGAVHAAIAQRVFGAVGPIGAPIRVVHDGVAAASYGAAAGAVGLGARAAGALAPASHTPAGAAAIAAVTALRGDVLERERSPLALPMSARRGGAPVDIAAFDGAERLAVFVHGLGETEFAWGADPYGDRLPGWTPLHLRYNTGLHISENGARLAALLERTDARRIALVGHSMGGLVARSACHAGAARGAAWVRRVSHVVSLGTPHHGAPLEQAVHVAGAALHAFPETRPFARGLRRRSAGIRDLRHGSLVDEDWSGADPDALRARACAEVPLLDGATHCFVAATITRSPRHPVGRLLGDGLVLAPSAAGRGRTRRLTFDDGMELGGVHHLALLGHPAVHERLQAWFAAPP